MSIALALAIWEIAALAVVGLVETSGRVRIRVFVLKADALGVGAAGGVGLFGMAGRGIRRIS